MLTAFSILVVRPQSSLDPVTFAAQPGIVARSNNIPARMSCARAGAREVAIAPAGYLLGRAAPPS